MTVQLQLSWTVILFSGILSSRHPERKELMYSTNVLIGEWSRRISCMFTAVRNDEILRLRSSTSTSSHFVQDDVVKNMLDKIKFIKDAKDSVNSLIWQFFIQGILLILVGVLIVMYPQLLILLFAFVFILIGLGSLMVAMRIRRFRNKFDKFFNLF